MIFWIFPQLQFTPLSPPALLPQLMSERSRMGRNASISTQAVLNSLPDPSSSSNSVDELVGRINDMFRRCVCVRKSRPFASTLTPPPASFSPGEHVSYLKSDRFARDLLRLNRKVKSVLEDEPRCVFLQSPAYVFGDIHGNLEDLHFFSDNVWNLGMSLTAGNFVFLGDYVDRGMSCLEVVAYLLAMKLSLPQKVFLLRGNHETRDVNGWEEHYGERSFIHQCRDRFGDDLGFRVWEATNSTFDRMPLAAVIDQDIFCVHGGIPRPISDPSKEGGRIRDILNVTKVAGINPPYEHEDEDHQQVASDCIWSDPASEDQEARSVDRRTGYGDSLRGGGAICFGHRAVTDFLAQQGFSYIMRAHEAHAEGVAVSKGARVFTVFSTSKDHNQGSDAMAGCILVDFEKMQVINRSPAYRNQYVHRRDSVSLAMLSEQEIAERVKLGLITSDQAPASAGGDDEEYEEEEWDEFDEDDDETGDIMRDADVDSLDTDDDDGYVLDTERRRSSVEPSKTAPSPQHGSQQSRGGVSVPPKRIDFSAMEDPGRKKKNGRFSSIAEVDEDDAAADEESTVGGEGDDCDENMLPFSEDSEEDGGGINGASGGSGLTPAAKRWNFSA